MSFSKQLGQFTGQPEGSLLRLDPNSLRTIVLACQYEDVVSLSQTCSWFRKLIATPEFWRSKMMRDFDVPYEPRFDFVSAASEKERYLLISDAVLSGVILGLTVQLCGLYCLSESQPNYQELYLKTKLALDVMVVRAARVKRDRLLRFMDGTFRRPRLVDWHQCHYKQLPKSGIERKEGRIFYRVTSDNVLDITQIYEGDDLWLPHLTESLGRGTLKDLMNILKLLDTPTEDKPQRDDFIHLSVMYFVHQRPDGVLEVIPIRGYHLPIGVLEMFKRRNIHSQEDLRFLYNAGNDRLFQFDTIGDPENPLRIPYNEREYQQMKPNYYHSTIN